MYSEISYLRELYETFGAKVVAAVVMKNLCGRTKIPDLRQEWYKLRYKELAPKPYEIIYVNPACIEYKLVPHFRLTVLDREHRILRGEWDMNKYEGTRSYCVPYRDLVQERSVVPFNETITYKSFKSHFQSGFPWGETEFYNHLFNRIKNGEQPFRYETKEKMRERLDQIDELYDEIRQNGYKRQKELKNENDTPLKEDIEIADKNEIVVNVGRNGEFIFDDGHHRLSIAKILELDRIPVRIFCRHKKWQTLREAVVKQYRSNRLSDSMKSFTKHPDIKPLLRGKDRNRDRQRID